MNISNATILKAAQAAGLALEEVRPHGGIGPTLFLVTSGTGAVRQFFPRDNDTDNAMIQDGAEIHVRYMHGASSSWVLAHGGATQNVDIVDGNKAQARRDAVILCAAAKWSARAKELELLDEIRDGQDRAAGYLESELP